MIVLYFELSKQSQENYRFPSYVYWRRHPSAANSEIPAGPKILVYQASRIWKLDTTTGVVTWQKNRDHGLMAPVDMDEFFLAQLAAVPYDGSIYKLRYA